MLHKLARALFLRSGLGPQLREGVKAGQRSTARLEKRVQELQKTEGQLRTRIERLEARIGDLAEKQQADVERGLDQRDRLHVIEELHLGARLATLELARRVDLEERLTTATAAIAATYPLAQMATHVRAALALSARSDDPFPHVVIDDVFPAGFHDLLYETRPPKGFWREGRESRENWFVGEDPAPLSTEAAWGYLDTVVVPHVLMPELTSLFADYLKGLPDVRSAKADRFEYGRSGGRVMLRRPGYHFEPHLDPHRAMLTGLFYAGTPQDSQAYGTKLFRTDRSMPESHRGVYYPLREGATCEFVSMVPSRPNSLLVFASRIGLHGADIPEDAPASLERYAYQFYIGKAQRGSKESASAY